MIEGGEQTGFTEGGMDVGTWGECVAVRTGFSRKAPTAGQDVAAAELALLARAKSGDTKALEALIGTHQDRVFRTALAILGHVQDAQDACQEVFIRFYRHLNRFDERRALAPWLYRITVNVCRDLAKKRKRSSGAALDGVKVEQLPFTRGDSHQAEAREEWGLVLACLQRLPSKERAALVLRDVEGLSTEEVAKTLGSTPMTVRSQISRARVKLKRYRDEVLGEKA